MSTSDGHGTGAATVTFDASAPAGRSVVVRALSSGGSAGLLLRFLFAVTLYVVGAWVVVASAAVALDLDAVHVDGLFTLVVIVLLTVGFWQQATRSATTAQGTYGAMTVRLGSDGLHISSRAFDVRCAWAAVDRVSIERGHLVLTYLKGRGVAIPADAFGSDAALRDFARTASDLRSGAPLG